MAESLNSLLPPINLLVARGNNWYPRNTNDESSMFCFPPPTMSKTPQNMPKNQVSYFGWHPFLTIQDGCHIEDPIWLPMFPATFIAI